MEREIGKACGQAGNLEKFALERGLDAAAFMKTWLRLSEHGSRLPGGEALARLYSYMNSASGYREAGSG